MLPKKSSNVTSSIVQSSSFSTLCVFSIFSFTIFIIYRYVKSLEKEVKQLSGKFDTLSMTVLTNTPMVDTNIHKSKDINFSNDFLSNENDCDDKGTVKSEEVIELIADLNDEEYCIPSVNNEIIQDKPQGETLENDDVELIIKDNLDEETLKKKTNEELKKMLKAKDKSTKGSKTELINRLLEPNDDQ